MSKERIEDQARKVQEANKLLEFYFYNPQSADIAGTIEHLKYEFAQTEPSSGSGVEAKRAQFNQDYQAIVSRQRVPLINILEAYIKRQEQELELLKEELSSA